MTAAAGASLLSAAIGDVSAQAHDVPGLRPGNLVVSRTVYVAGPGIITAGQTLLPPGCTTGCVLATSDGTYPAVWNNEQVDPSFGVTSPVYLDQITPGGRLVSSLTVPDGTGPGEHDEHGGLVTSFPSKSELALNLSTDGRYVTFMATSHQPQHWMSRTPTPPVWSTPPTR